MCMRKSHAHPVGGRTRRTSSAWPPGGRLRSRPSPAEQGHLGSGWPAETQMLLCRNLAISFFFSPRPFFKSIFTLVKTFSLHSSLTTLLYWSDFIWGLVASWHLPVLQGYVYHWLEQSSAGTHLKKKICMVKYNNNTNTTTTNNDNIFISHFLKVLKVTMKNTKCETEI